MAAIIKTVTGAQYGGIRKLQNTLANLASRPLSRAMITHMGGACGFKRTCKGMPHKALTAISISAFRKRGLRR